MTGVRPHVVLSGSLCAGKTTLAAELEQRGYAVVSARAVLRSLAGSHLASRRDLQEFGARLESESRGVWLAEAAEVVAATRPVVVDAVRTSEQLEAVSRVLGPDVVHVRLTADEAELRRRFVEREDFEDAGNRTLDDALSHPIERRDAELEARADIVIDTNAITVAEVLARLPTEIVATR